MSIDDLLRDLHEDRAGTVEEQLRAVEQDIARRRLVSAETVTTLFGQLGELRQEILQLLPPEGAADVHRVVREPLEREHRLVERELQVELRNRWRDLQELRREHRHLAREHREELQRYERNTGTYE